MSGGLGRQRDTAMAFTAGGLTVEIDEGWNEYDSDDVLEHHSEALARVESSGDGPALTNREFQKIMDGGLIGWVEAGETSPTAESFPSFRARCRAALDRLAEPLGPGETAIACTSGGVIAALTLDLLGAPPAVMVPLNRVAVNTAVTRIVHGKSGATLIAFNEISHLDGEAGLRTGR
ncbi:unannotated protein [freshwater metagenome]|uniref:Unannotated protein n=1 Tax=freshwater metagenome TaxID=449393 RepID=A0A6J7E5J5_9ZZZZ